MKSSTYLLPALAILMILGVSCNSKKSKREKSEKYEMNFEPSSEWQNLDLAKTSNMAHSGNSVCELDSAHEFSVTFSKKLSEFQKGMPKAVKAGMWVRLDDSGKETTLVMSIEKDGKSIQWESQSLKPMIKKAQVWTEINTLFNIKSEVPQDAVMKVYLWNLGKQHLLIDDVVIKPQY